MACAAALKAGKGRPLPPLASDWRWFGTFVNCEFHIVKVPHPRVEVVTPAGKAVAGYNDKAAGEAMKAQLPPQTKVDCSPTQEQVDAMVKEVDARNAANRAEDVAAGRLPPAALDLPPLPHTHIPARR